MTYTYAGDTEPPIIRWLRDRLKSITSELEQRNVEAALALIYSAMDTVSFMASPAEFQFATKSAFIEWCEQFIVPRLTSIGGDGPLAIDIYGARCGILHTSSPPSKLTLQGQAREIQYRHRGMYGVNLFLNTPRSPVVVDVEKLAVAFADGTVETVAEISKDSTRSALLGTRSGAFLRWVTLEPANQSPPEPAAPADFSSH